MYESRTDSAVRLTGSGPYDSRTTPQSAPRDARPRSATGTDQARRADPVACAERDVGPVVDGKGEASGLIALVGKRRLLTRGVIGDADR